MIATAASLFVPRNSLIGRWNRVLLACLCLGNVTASPGLFADSEDLTGLSHVERRAGWQSLFDGRTTNGWRNFRKPEIDPGWIVEDGSLVRAADGAGDLVTRDQFDHFELSFEYLISPGGNSGLMFHVSEQEDAPWKSGPEVQILDNREGSDPQLAGWLYGLYQPVKPKWVHKAEQAAHLPTPALPDSTRPAGDWNHVYLRVSPTEGELLLNGVRYYRFHKGSGDWQNRVAASKFKAYPNFGKAPRGHIALQDHGDRVAFRKIKIRPLAPDGSLPNPVDEHLAVQRIPAFPKLQYEGLAGENAEGKVQTIRPLALSGDGRGNLFVATQGGTVHWFANQPDVEDAHLALDLRDRVSDRTKANEEGLLGMALHPEFAQNGQLFVCYTSATDPRRTRISRFRGNAAQQFHQFDPAEEEILLEIPQPFANHNGGSIAFGPDGYLYIGLGDGGSQYDPLGNGQNRGTLLGSILRIDVDHASAERPYAIPADNPFVKQSAARPEIYALGFRNVWQLSFDTKTGDLWAADVGQDQWEEIDIVRRGGNYGWNLREGMQRFGKLPADPEEVLVDPVWQYDHRLGRSITGGLVYRGEKIPELYGHYLFADYVSGRIWTLEYDPISGRVRSHNAIAETGLPVLAFGQDERGEAYYLTEGVGGRTIYQLKPAR